MNVSVTEMARHFSEYLNRVSFRGESFQLVRGKKVLAELHPAPQGRRLGDLPGLFNALPRLSPQEAGGLARDISASTERLNRHVAKDPWAS